MFPTKKSLFALVAIVFFGATLTALAHADNGQVDPRVKGADISQVGHVQYCSVVAGSLVCGSPVTLAPAHPRRVTPHK